MNTDWTDIAAALGRIPSGCSILTVSHGGRSTGVLVSWVQQASFAPPAVTVCLKQGRPAAQWVDSSKRFLLNVIGEDSAPLFRHFGKGFNLEEDAFTGIPTTTTEFGPLIRSCIAHLGCRLITSMLVGDHVVYAAEVIGGSLTQDSPPYVHLRKNGLSY